MTEKKPYVIPVMEGGVVINCYAPDGTPIEYDVLDHDVIETGSVEALTDMHRWLEDVAETERKAGQPVSVYEALEKVKERLPEQVLNRLENEKREERGRVALKAYQEATGTDDEALGDLLADLMHMAGVDNYDFGIALECARINHGDEVKDATSWTDRVAQSRNPQQNDR